MEILSIKILIKIFPFLSLPLLFFSITNVLAIESIEDYVFEPDSNHIIAHMANGRQNFGNYMSIFNQINPASPNYKPTECLLLKDENMTFLSDFYSEIEYRNYNCKISQTPIAIPALTEGCSYGEFENPNDKIIEDCVFSHNPYAVVKVTINGKEIPNIDKFRITSDWSILNVTQKDNPYDIKLGIP